jgi:hypothetical protein
MILWSGHCTHLWGCHIGGWSIAWSGHRTHLWGCRIGALTLPKLGIFGNQIFPIHLKLSENN